MTSAQEWAALYRRELLDNVIPFWETYGIDRQCGGFLTCLDRQGRPWSTDKYMWLQGRAVWMFARLHRQLDAGRGWLDLATRGAAFLRAHGRDPTTGRVYFSLTRDGRPIHLQRKIYSEVFYVLALCEMARATGREEYLAEARDVFWLIYDLWRHPEKLGRPMLSGTPRGSSLADPMVFLCMIEELSPIDADPRYAELADEMTRVALRHVRRDRQLVLEHVGPDGETFDTPKGRLINPGHAIEMGWFLIHLAQRTGRRELMATALEIIDWSFRAGWDTEFGGLYYFLDADGRPCTQLEANMKLWWPATEALYALALAWRVTGDDRWLDLHRKNHDWAWQHFRDPEFGEWFGYLDRRGEPTHQLKGGEWKGFFHLPRALLYLVLLLES